MAKKKETVSARPVKSFFVEMLTRDISLQDAILDLLDNSVDGIQRSATKRVLNKKKPYDGYHAKITISEQKFTISDNCGGIPWANREYAFRMGRCNREIDNGRRTVGTFGIGMKRAIFKMGLDCTISTHAKDRSYEVLFSSKWMKDEDNWNIDINEIPKKKPGTNIEIRSIHSAIKHSLKSKEFVNELYEAVSTHYAYIMEKGFKVYINGKTVKPKTIKLLFSESKGKAKKEPIHPFIYETNYKGVDVFLAVGFTSPIPSTEQVDEALEVYRDRFSSLDAGWTVICNDRTVLYCDKSHKTGWGVSGVPQYHTQFIAISGIVTFSSSDASLLPTTTTKRGIELDSNLYMHVRDKMIEGMKIFIQYTNKWKSKELAAKSRERLKEVESFDLNEIQTKSKKLKKNQVQKFIKGEQYKPTLPSPTQRKAEQRIVFKRSDKDIKKVSRYLFDTLEMSPNDVGEKCFETILEEAGE